MCKITHIMGNENNKQARTNVPIEHTTTISSSQPTIEQASTRIVQNFVLIRLDENNIIDQNTITKLREIVNTIYTFTNIDDCISFITKIKNKQIFIIISGKLGQTTVPILHDIVRINSIYIFCENKNQHEQWTKQWSKIKGVFIDLIPICEVLKKAVQESDQNTISISFIPPSDDHTKDKSLDQSFVYIQILKEILLTINFEDKHFIEFINYCREKFDENPFEMKNLVKIEKEYHRHTPIWWYTYPCFLSSMLHCALYTMEIDLIITLAFFIRDLHQQISQLHSKQYNGQHSSNSFIVYRSQNLSQTDFDQMKETKGGLLSFNNFLLTNKNREISLNFVRQTSDVLGILFVITIDPSISSTPFANLRNIGYNSKEEAILFSIHSIFRIEDIKQIDENNRLWQVNLTLISNKSSQLNVLTEYIQKETFPEVKGWYRLGELLIKFNHYDKAEQLYNILLDQTSDELDKGNIYHQLGLIMDKKEQYTQAVIHYEKSITIKNKILPPTHSNLASLYNNVGLVYEKLGQFVKALSYQQKALDIYQKNLSEDDLNLSYCYDNIGRVYQKFIEYSKALTNYEKALTIRQKILPADHPDLAISHMNIGGLYDKMKDNSKALLSYESALTIQQQILPVDHLDLAITYTHIGTLYSKMDDLSKALLFHEKALEIYEKILPPNDTTLITCYNAIGMVCDNMGQLLKALSCYEKVLEIQQNNLSENHANLAVIYTNIGSIYDKMGEYTKALSSHEKALDIRQQTLAPNHPSLAISYSNIGMVFETLGEYSKALSSHEKALEIRQKGLSGNSFNLASSYNEIGCVYYGMGEYSKALSYHATALKIYQTRPSSHYFGIACCYNNIGRAYEYMGEYLKALSYHQQTFEIYQKHLPSDHSYFGVCYAHMGKVYNFLGDTSKALSLQEKALEICEKSVPPNLYSVSISKYNIGLVYDKIGDYTKALSYYESAIELGQRTLPPNHPRIQTWIQTLETVKSKV